MTPSAPPRSASPALGDLIGLLLTLLALVVAWKLAVPRAVPAIPTLPAAACDLQREDCRLTLGDNSRVDLRIPGRPIVPNQPFVIEASVAGGDVRLLEVEVQGVEVNIGSPPTVFASAEDGDLPDTAQPALVHHQSHDLANDGVAIDRWALPEMAAAISNRNRRTARLDVAARCMASPCLMTLSKIRSGA